MRPTSRALQRLESPYVLPQKLTFDFSKDRRWATRLRSWSSGWQKTPLSSKLGKAWPAKIADAPEYQPSPRIVIGEDGGWLSSVRNRLGKCISFGLREPRVRQAGKLLKALGAETETAGWRGLTLRRYGFSFNEGKPYSLMVRGRHPLLGRALTTKVRFNPPIDQRQDEFAKKELFRTQRMYWFRNFTMSKFGHVKGKEKLAVIWNSIHHPHGPYDIEINELHTSIFDQASLRRRPMRGPTGNLTVCHRLRPGFVKPDGTLQNRFVIDSLVVSARQERVVAQATASLSFVARKGVDEPEKFDELVGYYFLSMMEEQERLKTHAEKKIIWIENEVRSIEKASWDKEGAVEDLGSAARPEQAGQKEEVVKEGDA
ncbi:hypothetical protein IWX90DRAFT_411622 [Phyllosticta citrichinensis]|uniref:Uncharacterized protein n=1 Tax=Phyllosticta citrichinensis TaxID=1130410 RepID=A0ABR1Y1S7_9PEZI